MACAGHWDLWFFSTPSYPIKKLKYFLSHVSPLGRTNHHSSLYCKTKYTWLVHRVICLFSFQPKLVLILLTPEGWKAESTYSYPMPDLHLFLIFILTFIFDKVGFKSVFECILNVASYMYQLLCLVCLHLWVTAENFRIWRWDNITAISHTTFYIHLYSLIGRSVM